MTTKDIKEILNHVSSGKPYCPDRFTRECCEECCKLCGVDVDQYGDCLSKAYRGREYNPDKFRKMCSCLLEKGILTNEDLLEYLL